MKKNKKTKIGFLKSCGINLWEILKYKNLFFFEHVFIIMSWCLYIHQGQQDFRKYLLSIFGIKAVKHVDYR